MKNQFSLLVLSIPLICLLAISCAGTSNNSENTGRAAFSNVIEKEWSLIKVRVSDNETLINREALANDNAGDLYTLKFDNNLLSGKAEPNTYSAPYTINEAEQTISIKPMRSTLMASFRQSVGLAEHDYYTYMNNAYKWEIVNNNLILHSKSADEQNVQLVFE